MKSADLGINPGPLRKSFQSAQHMAVWLAVLREDQVAGALPRLDLGAQPGRILP
jgi:hypothetical protein